MDWSCIAVQVGVEAIASKIAMKDDAKAAKERRIKQLSDSISPCNDMERNIYDAISEYKEEVKRKPKFIYLGKSQIKQCSKVFLKSIKKDHGLTVIHSKLDSDFEILNDYRVRA